MHIKTPILVYLFFLTVNFCALGSFAQQNQPDTTLQAPGSEPITAPGPNASVPNQVLPENLEARIQQLREAGVAEETIQQFIQQSLNSQNTQPSTVPKTVSSQPEPPSQEQPTVDPTQSLPELMYEQFQVEQKIARERIRIQEEDRKIMKRRLQARQRDSVLAQRNAIYGQHIFSTEFRFYQRSGNFIPPEDYIMGPGDNLIVAAWDGSELYENLTLDEEGAVFRQYLGKIQLGGLTFGQAKRVLRNKYRRNIAGNARNIEIRMGLGGVQRKVGANVVAYVQRPGTYELSANSHVLDALFEAGGVSNKGTVRNILLKRGNRTIANVDLYAHLMDGAPLPYIQNNDFILVPLQGKVVSIRGDITRPMHYELKEGEKLKDLVYYAGGLNYDARTSSVRLTRFVNGKRLLRNFDLKALWDSGSDLELLDGDAIQINAQTKELYNTVEARGSMKYPGAYQLLKGDRVSELIEKAGGLDTLAYLKRAYITRIVNPGSLEYIPIDLEEIVTNPSSPDNMVLQFFDQLRVFSELDFVERRSLRISGMVRRPGSVQLAPGMSLKDVLYFAGGLKENADTSNVELSTFLYAEDIDNENIDPDESDDPDGVPSFEDSIQNKTVRYVKISKEWWSDPTLDTLMVGDFKSVKIFSTYDFIFPRFVELTGAVKSPGRFQITRETTLKDLLFQAGGLLENADVSEIELYQDIEIKEKGKFGTLAKRPEIVRIQLDADWQESVIADTLKVNDLTKIVVRSEGEFFRQGSVKINGLVGKPGTYQLLPNMTMKDLIYMAGGIDITADFDKIEHTRVIEIEDENGNLIPISTEVNFFSTIQDWQKDSLLDKILLNPFDQIFVRENPDFELQESVFIEGEILVPGEYNKIQKFERLNSIVERAGWPTDLAYLQGAYIERAGVSDRIAIKLDKALKNPRSKRYNIPLLNGDKIVIPPLTNVITIGGNVLQPGTTVLFEPQKTRYKYYVNLAGGFDRRTKRKLSTISYVDGRTKRVKSFWGMKFYPKVEQGASIEVAAKPEKKGFKANLATGRVNLQEILASATAILTFYLLLDRSFQ